MIPVWDKFSRPLLIWIYFFAALLSGVGFRVWGAIAGRGRGGSRYPARVCDRLMARIKTTSSRRPAVNVPSPLPFVSVVIPVYNAQETLEFCLESLMRQSWPASSREIIVVDNMCTDRSREIAGRFDVQIVDCPFRGPSAARNAGVEAARGEWVAFLDADCIAAPRWLERLAAAAERHHTGDEAVVMLGGEVRGLYFGNKAMERFGGEAGLLDQESAVSGGMLGLPFVVTANAIVLREEFLRQGGFDPALGPGEDSEFGWRLHFSDRRMVYVPEARVWHFHRVDGLALYRQFFRYGFNEMLAAAKWRGDLSAGLYVQLAWFRPFAYRLFWKRSVEMIVALLTFQHTKFQFLFYMSAADLAHMAGVLQAHFARRDFSGFVLFPEMLDADENSD